MYCQTVYGPETVSRLRRRDRECPHFSARRLYTRPRPLADSRPDVARATLAEGRPQIVARGDGDDERDYMRSKMPAAPMPPPMHIVTMP